MTKLAAIIISVALIMAVLPYTADQGNTLPVADPEIPGNEIVEEDPENDAISDNVTDPGGEETETDIVDSTGEDPDGEAEWDADPDNGDVPDEGEDPDEEDDGDLYYDPDDEDPWDEEADWDEEDEDWVEEDEDWDEEDDWDDEEDDEEDDWDEEEDDEEGDDEELDESAFGDFCCDLLEDGTLMITDYADWDVKELSIPSELGGRAVTAIGDLAFCSCDSLRSVTIPDSVVTVGFSPFDGCEKLEAILVSEDHPCLQAVDLVLFDKNTNTLITYPMSLTADKYVIPAGTAAIADYAFSGCEQLRRVTIPDSVTEIGEDVFEGCENVILLVVKGTCAEQYAEENGIRYATAK